MCIVFYFLVGFLTWTYNKTKTNIKPILSLVLDVYSPVGGRRHHPLRLHLGPARRQRGVPGFGTIKKIDENSTEIQKCKTCIQTGTFVISRSIYIQIDLKC